jgi:hypothetical protein
MTEEFSMKLMMRNGRNILGTRADQHTRLCGSSVPKPVCQKALREAHV